MPSPRDRAVELLTHYVTVVMERPGTRVLKVDDDSRAELAELVDAIVAASVEAVAKVAKEGR